MFGTLSQDTPVLCVPLTGLKIYAVSLKTAVFTPARARLKELLFPNQEVSDVAELHKKA